MRASLDWPGRPRKGMKVDWSTLSGRRQWQLARNAKLAEIAQKAVVAPDEYGDPVPLSEDSPYRNARGFVVACVSEC